MNVIKIISEFRLEENRLLKTNKKEIDENNKRMLHLMLKIGWISFALFLIISLIVTGYGRLSMPYLYMLVLLILFLLFYKKLLRKIPVVCLMYIGYGTMVLYSIYTSALITPDFSGVIILFFLFQMPIVILDKGWRINLIVIICAVTYLACVLPFKEQRLIPDEVLNCILFTVVSIVLGKYMRKSKLDNFELKRQAILREKIDFLTGLGNRRCLYSDLTYIQNSIEKLPYIGIIMLDIDKFKLYNDTYGHQAGDTCLKTIGDYLLAFAKENNITFYRYGGEEFLGIATGYSSQELYAICQKINQSVLGLKIPNRLNEGNFLTISIGMTVCQEGEKVVLQQLISHADTALYAAKAGGRNKTVVYDKQKGSV